MIIDVRQANSTLNLEADICILGGGVAGIVLANELKEKFGKVVILESGTEQYDQETQDLYAPDKIPEIYPNPLYSRLRFLGGASNHWSNNTTPLSAIDFEERDWVENSGWPINYKDIQPFYKSAAKYCQTGEDSYDTNKWLPELNFENPFSGSKYTEVGIAKAAIPATRFYAAHGNSIENSSNVTIYKNANVIGIDFDKTQKKVNTITFSSLKKENHTITADKFIMCMGGIENARMLKYFNVQNNNALGNQNDNVGRYFMDHPTLRAAHLYTNSGKFANLTKTEEHRFILAFFQLKESALRSHGTTNLRLPLDQANQYSMSDGISSFHILKEKLSNGELPDQVSQHLANLFTDFDMVLEAVSRKQFDKRLFDSANDISGFQIPLMLEQTPHRENRILLGNKVDQFGIPKISVQWRLMEGDKTRLWKSLSLFAKDVGLLSLGRLRVLKERQERLFNSQLGFGHHHMGTTRMSSSEQTGVVDHNMLVFGTENLYVAGCSTFPTGGHVPPTLTIVALAIRLAGHLSKEFGNEN